MPIGNKLPNFRKGAAISIFRGIYPENGGKKFPPKHGQLIPNRQGVIFKKSFIFKIHMTQFKNIPKQAMYTGADKSLARPTSRCILFDGKNIPFDASLVIYIISTNIPPIMIINRIYETQNLLSL